MKFTNLINLSITARIYILVDKFNSRMDIQQLKKIIEQGEGTQVQFKTAYFALPKTLFETICGFLNRNGGHLLLGVKDDKTIEGVLEDSVQSLIDQIVTNANNAQLISPPFYLAPQVFEIDQKKVIYLFVPQSSQIHRFKNNIYDRNEDGDFSITNQYNRVTQLYLKKQSTHSENKVYPFLQLSDLKKDLFRRVRILATNNNPGHPWSEMEDMELIRSAGLYRKDYQTGKEGFTLAAILLLGKEEVIFNVLPFHKTDAIVKVDNVDRYDDRDDIRTNLIESYDRLMAFIKKHLPDRFAQEGTHRISARDKIFHEVIGNVLIHREYTNPFPAKLIIEKNRVVAENWNRPNGIGLINPKTSSPFPKNPIIARFFRTIGRADELGSGVINTFKYASMYTPGQPPIFEEGDVFKTIIAIKKNGGTYRPYPESGIDESINDTVKEVNEPVNYKNESVNKAFLQFLKLYKKDRLSPKVVQRLLQIAEAIQSEQVVNRQKVVELLQVSTSTAARYIKLLCQANILVFKGAPKTGHY